MFGWRMIGEEMNEMKRRGEKMSEKENDQSHFHCLVKHEFYISPFIFVLSSHFLFSRLLIFFQIKYAKI